MTSELHWLFREYGHDADHSSRRPLPQERDNWRLIAGGQGIHWGDFDEDISIDSLLAGRRSTESPTSFQRWLTGRI